MRYTTSDHVIVRDDPNYNLKTPLANIENQGTTVARVNQWILLPGDALEMSMSNLIEKRLEIKFLAAFPFKTAIANFPQLWSGNRLAIIEMNGKYTETNRENGAGSPGRMVIHRSSIGLLDAMLDFTGGGLATANTQTPDRQTVGAGTYNISAGAYKVRVLNNGLYDITVNGDTVPPNETWEAEVQFNKTNNRQDFCPAVEIVVPASGSASYYTIFPST